MTTDNDAHLDELIFGALNIAAELKLLTKQGEPNGPKALYHLRRGQIPHGRMGAQYVTTRRRLRELSAAEFHPKKGSA